MRTDYDRIRADNIEEYGKGTRHLSFLQRLYADRTHFVFELLQNAEDALAKRVRFDLFTDRLEVRRDGSRLFDEKDVRAICGVGESTGADDLTRIGKFGIGFKSVYAYTATPEIHCGNEHFRIEHYVRPYPATKRTPGGGWTTLFILTFNAPDVVATKAWREIASRLRNLGARTLLFLREIESIEYSLEKNREYGEYRREDCPRGQAREVILHESGDKEDWLVFSRSVPCDVESEKIRVEIAFRLSKKGKTSEKLVAAKPSPLVVFFPTDRETELGFLVQGPYRTTPARDNIPVDDDWNRLLVEETASLLSGTLVTIRKMGLLSVGFLEALPIRIEDFPPDGMFQPIVDSVRDSFRKRSLLPTVTGDYVPAGQAKLARSRELRDLISEAKLTELFSSRWKLHWLSGEISHDRTPDLRTYLLNELEIEEVTPEDFASQLNREFLESCSDRWIIRFYTFLLEHEALWRDWGRPGTLRSKEIIRLSDGTHVVPFQPDDRPNAYLPASWSSEYPEVKKEIARNEQALEFLTRLGLREVGERESIEGIIKSYYVDRTPNPNAAVHLKHIEKFIAWTDETGETDLFDDCFLFFDRQQSSMHAPRACYLDMPFKNTGLACLFKGAHPEKVPIWNGYAKLHGFVDFAVRLGAMDKLEIDMSSRWSAPYRGQIIQDHHISDLRKYLRMRSPAVSNLIWSTMRNASPGILVAVYESNRWNEEQRAPSSIVQELRDHEWIPTKSGEFIAPRFATADQLADGLEYDDRNGWLSAIGFGEATEQSAARRKEIEEYASALGIKNPEALEIAKEIDSYPDLFDRFRSLIAAQRAVQFPQRAVGDHGVRRQNIVRALRSSPDKSRVQKQRTIRESRGSIDPSTWLREQYTNDDGQMVCQICKVEMPFRKRDGQYYFEAVEAIDDVPIEQEQLFLALCPLCAAKFKELVKRHPEAIATFKGLLDTSEEPEIPVQLGPEETSVRFVETHIVDLKAILEVYN